jgi:endonuclease V-like protein UPF0215 family
MKRVRIAALSFALSAGLAFGVSAVAPTTAAAASAQTSATQLATARDGTRAGGVVASVSGTTITVTGRNGTAKAIQTTSSTTFTLDGGASTLSAIAAGQYLRATGTTDSNGVFTATSVAASTTAPQGRGDRQDGTRAGGVVASVSGTTITVTGRNGTTKAIQTTSSTTFTLDGAASSLSAIAAGQYFRAQGTTDSNGVFTATNVAASTTAPQGRGDRQEGTRAGGVVAGVSGTTITVTRRNGTTKAIQTTSSTTFTLDGAASSLSAIAAGQYLRATGTTDSNGVFTATSVVVSTTAPQGRGSWRP